MNREDLFRKAREVRQIASVDFSNLQSYQSMLDTFTLGNGVFIGGSYVLPTRLDQDILQFDVDIKPGFKEAYTEHWHDCLEVCEIMAPGMMADLMIPKATAFNVGDKIIYPPAVPHQPYNPGRDILHIKVTFYRNSDDFYQSQ